MDDTTSWTFPKAIGLEEIPEYLDKFSRIDTSGLVVFDLSRTVSMHSSFVGFLIHAKHAMLGNGGRLILRVSSTIERILAMLNILEYFLPDCESPADRKSA